MRTSFNFRGVDEVLKEGYRILCFREFGKGSSEVLTVVTPRSDEAIKARIGTGSAVEGLMFIGREGLSCIGREELTLGPREVRDNPLDIALGVGGYLEVWGEKSGRRIYPHLLLESGELTVEGERIRFLPGQTIMDESYSTFSASYNVLCNKLREAQERALDCKR